MIKAPVQKKEDIMEVEMMDADNVGGLHDKEDGKWCEQLPDMSGDTSPTNRRL